MFNFCSKPIPPVKEGLQAEVSVSRLSHQRQRDHAASVDGLGRRGIHQNVFKVQRWKSLPLFRYSVTFTLAAACDAISQAYDDEGLDVVNSRAFPKTCISSECGTLPRRPAVHKKSSRCLGRASARQSDGQYFVS